MTPADRMAMDDLASAMRSCDRTMQMLAPIWMASLPQLVGAEALRERWNMGRDKLIAFLEQYAGYCGEPGKPISIPIEVVLRLDLIAKTINSSVPLSAARGPS